MLTWSADLPELALLFGAHALVDGALAIAAGSRPQGAEIEWLLEGVLAMSFGAIALLWLDITLPALIHLVALGAVTKGLFELMASARLDAEVPERLSLGFAGTGSLVLGAAMLLRPAQTAFAFVAHLGCYAMFFGTSMTVLALRLYWLVRRGEAKAMDANHAIARVRVQHLDSYR